MVECTELKCHDIHPTLIQMLKNVMQTHQLHFIKDIYKRRKAFTLYYEEQISNIYLKKCIHL